MKVSIAYERIELQEIKILEEKWKEFKNAVLKCPTEVCGFNWKGKG